MKDRLILGTANFGLDYGIANRKMLKEKEVLAILEKAREIGIPTVDTAQSYGNAEKIIGKFLREHGKVFQIITKLPAADYRSSDDVKKAVEKSLASLSVSHIDYLFIHSYSTFEHFGKTVFPVLEDYVEQGVIGNAGISAYHPFEVDNVLNSGYRISAVELPLNLFDKRFLNDNYLTGLMKRSVQVFVRSLFMQGLFFMDSEKLASFFNPVKDRVRRIKEISDSVQLPIECLALMFVLSHDVDGVLLGVDSAEQLESNLRCFHGGSREVYSLLKDEIRSLEVNDEEIILPYKWRLN